MKKIVVLTLVFVLCFATSAFAAEKKETPMKVTKDGITVEVTSAKLKEIKGDRTKDNYADENGDFIAYGGKIVKASEYRNLALKVKYTNKSKADINLSSLAWGITLPGEKKEYKQLADYKVGKKLTGKVKKNSTVEDELTLIVKMPSKTSGFVLNYRLMDYTDEYKKLLQQAITGKITEKEWNKKYKDKYTPKELAIQLIIKQ
ncbi:hypothetical protein [Paenibacillus apiarius]|uniref:DUF4352 domain-containing protein n=1 Tax=Paenibacillus apiarius TaxID=46240 RepID=A0ABT4DQS4_9BACL|nr:hypothetical protein [Paenibacillus apiarius]MCY9513316.1 hypothetical protein [Paenibacillus apiarius]MCY9519712.1 hypothetical protein [Paenibacillus apiarius]MCY9553232.1 hypothetical protein [Paenibacillus apiarius]MCY9557082.1 hypothetical protein [Paenibacillus apiarius]MCY9682177.1 hypothetical protein [Paenibacillus apiarius]